jgi:HAD superfamily hydrolase (TIGR01450 family)
LTAAFILARHMGRTVKEQKGKVLVVGTEGLMAEIAAHTPFETVHARDYSSSANDSFVAVALGNDRSFDYACLAGAMAVLQRHNCPLFACNLDASFPTSDGSLLPGSGAIVKAVEYASGKGAVVVGKPNGYLFDELVALQHAGFSAKRTVMIGDCLYTDIAFARRHGMASVLVETGTKSQEHKHNSSFQLCRSAQEARSLQIPGL